MKKMTEMKGGISCEGMSPEWVAREGKKGDTLIKAGMLETQGEIEEPLRLYALAAAEEEELAQYCESIGLHEKAYYHWLSGANCWAAAGNPHRGIQLGEKMLTLEILTPHKREQVERTIQRIRDAQQEWFAWQKQREQSQEQSRTETRRKEPLRTAEPVAV